MHAGEFQHPGLRRSQRRIGQTRPVQPRELRPDLQFEAEEVAEEGRDVVLVAA